MNPRMWAADATRANAEMLRRRGVELVGPAAGDTAEGELGVGRMAEPEEIAGAIERRLAVAGQLAGRRVLVTAGGTREPLDAVRYIGNRSSGRMGVAVADEAARRGADVTLLLCAGAVAPETHVNVIARRDGRAAARGDGRARARRRRGGDGRRRRRLPAGGRRGRQAHQGRRRLVDRARADRGHPGRAGRRAAATGSC